MNNFWVSGRQNASYFKRKLFEVNSAKLKFDCYLLKYTTGSYIEPHVDPVKSGHHYRLNIVLISPISGGVFKCSETVINWFNRIILFRPDVHKHELTKVIEGNRIVLSIGWIRNISA